VRLIPNNGHILTIIFSIFNRDLIPNTLQFFKKMLGSPYKARGLMLRSRDRQKHKQSVNNLYNTVT
jgi:hypothetical protein